MLNCLSLKKLMNAVSELTLGESGDSRHLDARISPPGWEYFIEHTPLGPAKADGVNSTLESTTAGIKYAHRISTK
jgi:hypothetical protein